MFFKWKLLWIDTFLFQRNSSFLFFIPKVGYAICNDSQYNCYQNMEHDTNAQKHIAMFRVTKDRRHCQKTDYNRYDCSNQGCHPKIFSFPKEKEYHRCNGNDIKYRDIPPIHKHPPFFFPVLLYFIIPEKHIQSNLFASCLTLFHNKKS